MEEGKTQSDSPTAVRSHKNELRKCPSVGCEIVEMHCHRPDDVFWSANKRQYLVIAIINMVTFLCGASQGTASISVPRLMTNESRGSNDTTWPRDFEVTEDEEEWITRTWLISHILSGLVSNSIAEILGRKKSLLIDCFAYLIGYALYGIGEDAATLCVGRAFMGYPLVTTVYLFELIHVDMRGLGAAAFAFMFALGGSTMALLGAIHPFWRHNMLAVASLTILALFIIAYIVPESPIWLLRKGREQEAEASMRILRGDKGFKQEFSKMKSMHVANMEQAASKHNMGKTWSVPLQNIVSDTIKGKRKPPKLPFSFIFLAILFSFIGWSGITYIALNGPKLFVNQAEHMGIDHYYMNFIVSLAKIPGGFFAAIFLKKFPTRLVFLVCAILISIAHIMMGLTNMMLLPPAFAMISIGIIQFTSSAGYISVSYLLLGTLLPSSSRSTFTGLVAMMGGLSALSLNAVRPYIISTPIGDAGLFFVFAAVVIACLIYMFFMMPETKGISLEHIEYIFLCPPHEGCAIRRDPNRIITNAVESVALMVERVFFLPSLPTLTIPTPGFLRRRANARGRSVSTMTMVNNEDGEPNEEIEVSCDPNKPNEALFCDPNKPNEACCGLENM